MKRYYIMLVENENENEKIRVFSGDTIDECATKRDKYFHEKFGTGEIAGIKVDRGISTTNRDLCEYLAKTGCLILDLKHRFIF